MQQLRTHVHKIIPSVGFRQMIKFGMVGVINTIIDYSVYLVMTRIFVLPLLSSNAVAMLVAMTFSFFANKHFTFRNRDTRWMRQMLIFITIQAIAFGIAMSLFYFMLELGLHDVVAKIIGSIGFTTWNFLAQKYWAFRSK